jgi:hypothetical protein
LSAYFLLPSIRTLKQILSNIPFDAGINQTLLMELKAKNHEMNDLNKYCTLIFDEISLSSGYHYEREKDIISGYEDLGGVRPNCEIGQSCICYND